MEACLLGDESYWATVSDMEGLQGGPSSGNKGALGNRRATARSAGRTWISQTARLSHAVEELYSSSAFGRAENLHYYVVSSV